MMTSKCSGCPIHVVSVCAASTIASTISERASSYSSAYHCYRLSLLIIVVLHVICFLRSQNRSTNYVNSISGVMGIGLCSFRRDMAAW
ncbi:hypothetical protein AcW2_007432 [Taiwanofungus camphoratus]|nr:hypothetical protein AcW2_007432 [Antrodia cinnamomea]